MDQKQRLFAVLAVTAMAAAGSPEAATASTTAGAKLVNVVEVEYSDTSGKNTFRAAASTTVTVNLVKSAPNASTAPADGAVAGLGCLGSLDTVSGGTVSAIYALSATANGSDSYDLSIGADAAASTKDASDITRSFSTLAYDGTPVLTGAQARVLGSAIPVGIDGADTLLFPGGALAGFEKNDIVLVEIGLPGSKVKKAYKVLNVAAGNPATHDNDDGAAYTTGTIAKTKEETPGRLQLEAYGDYSIDLNGVAVPFGGGGDAPAFDEAATAPTMGAPVGELVLVQVDITASASSVTLDGFVGYTLTAYNGTDSTELTCTAGFFRRAQLSIKKEVRTLPDLAWGATAAGKPGDVLEYRVTVANPGGQAALVKVTDAVPVYTTLVTHSAGYGDGLGGPIFAQVLDGAGTAVTITTAADSEIQAKAPYETGYGDAAGTTANSAINFFVGDTSESAKGGTVPSCSNASVATAATCTSGGGTWLDTYTILYQVKID